MVLVDLSHTVEHGMETYPGLPGPEICDFLTRAEAETRFAPGVTFQIGRIEMVANTGTYVDAPFHRFETGRDLAALPLERLADLDGVRVRIDPSHGREIGPECFAGVQIGGRAVLVETGWSRHWRTPRYSEGHPFLTREAAELLAGSGACFVGIDSLNIDDTAALDRPVHTILLGQDIPIGEHLTRLDALPGDGFRFHAAPVKVQGMGTFPVRAYAVTG